MNAPRRPPSLPLLLAIASLTASNAEAADWVMIAGGEQGKPEVAVQPVAFVQVVGAATPFAQPVAGLASPALAPFNDEVPSFNVEGPFELAVRRVRLGARGTLPMTDRAVTYVLTVEAGQNAATRGIGVNLMDASISVHAIPGLRLRAGQFKLPTMDETLEMNPLAADFINFSPIVLQLMLEQPVKDGAFIGPAFAGRDIGVQAFDSYLLPAAVPVAGEHLELSWAGVLSQGQAGGLDPDVHKDLTVRAMLSVLPSAKERYKPLREEVAVFAWRLQGARVVDGEAFDRVRQGVGVHARLFHTRARIEVVHAEGMLFTGQTPAFEGQPIVVDPTGTALGWTAGFSVEHLAPFELNAGIEELSRYDAGDPRHRLFRTVVLGAQLKWTESVKLMVNWELRRIGVDDLAPADARAISDSIGDVIAAQLTVML